MAMKKSAAPAFAAEPVMAANVIPLRQRVTARHNALLARWLAAGERMGLCDAQAFRQDAPRQGDYVLVWVRENPSPAYMVEPVGMRWVVTDLLRDQELARLSSFAVALNFIRPVLSVEIAA
jgi:hypothetical protein